MDMFTILIVVRVSWCIHMLKIIKLYTLNMCSSLYINDTSIKQIFKKPLRCRDQNCQKVSRYPTHNPSCLLQSSLPFSISFTLLECSYVYSNQTALMLTEPCCTMPFPHRTPWSSSIFSVTCQPILTNLQPLLFWTLLQGLIRFSVVYKEILSREG